MEKYHFGKKKSLLFIKILYTSYMNNKTIKIKRKIPKEEIAEKFTKNETPKSQNSQKVEPKKSFREKDNSIFSVISEQNTIFVTCQA